MLTSQSFCTARLTARRVAPDDFERVRAIHADPGALRVLPAEGSLAGEQARLAIFDRHLRHWPRSGVGLWLFSLTDADEPVGYCGLRRQLVNRVEETELFYGLRSRFRRHGFAIEMARAIAAIAFAEVGAESIVTFALQDPPEVRLLMRKLGMSYEAAVEHAGLPHLMYRLRRESHRDDPGAARDR